MDGTSRMGTYKPMDHRNHTLVIGAGIGGLTTAALLLHAGHQVTVLEAHTYPGGSAGTFYHQKYLFDAGATLAGGFSPGEPHARVGQLLNIDWPVKSVDPAWIVHLPDGRTITQWSDPQLWQEEWQSKFPATANFWHRQEMLASVSWDLASRPDQDPIQWPPHSAKDFLSLARTFRPSTLKAAPYLKRSVSDLISTDEPGFKNFLDAQLLISAQTVADKANALYGSAALDLPRRGVCHVQGGMGSLAKNLVTWIKANGGQVFYRQKVKGINLKNGRVVAVETKKGQCFTADNFVANVTPWALVNLLNESVPPSLQRVIKNRPPTWGAFTLYLGLESNQLPKQLSDHHQVIMNSNEPLGEANSVFISLADPTDTERAPSGKRPATLSTHTAIAPWWQLFTNDRAAYLDRREQYTESMLAAAERAIPGIKQAINLSLPGTPITFEYYTSRPQGMVGGFPQTSLFSSLGPQTGISNLHMVGDSIFPGQSTAGVTLGAMRVSAKVLERSERFFVPIPQINPPLAIGE